MSQQDHTDSFVQEVDESLRQDRTVSFIKKYGPWIAGAAAVVILGLGAWQMYGQYMQGVAREHGDRYVAAQQMLRDGDLDGAKAAFEALYNGGPNSYRTMARMEHAAILQAQGDLDGALAGFDDAASVAQDPILKQSAEIRAAYIAADTQDFTALRARVQPLIDAHTPTSYLAQELLGVEAWEAGDLELARSTLESLTLAFEAPEAVRQRAQIALSVIGPAPAPAANQQPEAAPQQTPARRSEGEKQ
ncbi:tetratricopeptide repeat protein [Terricaulis sp.]|uniref:tetratricopeptide repeat protein n=1 Tax=Terricaulis sp. TaxID=2768686 RepID=UPI0037833F9E